MPRSNRLSYVAKLSVPHSTTLAVCVPCSNRLSYIAIGEPGIVHVAAARVNSQVLGLWRIGRRGRVGPLKYSESVP